jgi:hypothetical protein
MNARPAAARAPARAFALDPLLVIAAAWTLFWMWVALALRPIGDFGVETDFYGDFAVYAREWAAGKPSLMNGFRGPFYYILLAVIGKTGLDLFAVAKVLSVLSAGACLLLAGQLLRKILGQPAAIAGVLLIAASPTFIDYAYRACNDLVFLALALGALRLLFVDDERVVRGWAAAGLLAGAAWMTRYNGSVLVPAAFVVAPLLFGRTRRTLQAPGAFLAGWLVVSLPWLLFVAGEAGSPFWNKAYENIAIEVLTEDPNRAQITGFMSAIDIRSVGDIWNVSPARFLRVMAGNVVDHLVSDARKLVGIPWAIVAVLGLGLGFRAFRNRRALAFALVGALTYASLLPVFYNERFMLPLLPFWAAAAGGLATALAARGAAAGGRAAEPAMRGAARKPGSSAAAAGPSPLLTGLFLALGLLALYGQVQGFRLATDPTRFGGLPGEYLRLVENVTANGLRIGPDTPIAARKPHLAWFFGAPTVGVPTGSMEELRGSGAHYLLVSGSEVGVYPSLASIWVPRSAADVPQGLRLAASGQYRRPNGDQMVATLYAIENPVPYVEKPRVPFKAQVAPPAGMERTDFLRWQIVRWSLRSGARNSPEEFLGVMSPAGREHPETQRLVAWAALRDGRTAAAEDTYRRLLAADPGDRTALLGLASCAVLENRPADHRKWINAAFGTPADSAWPAIERLKIEADPLLSEMNPPASLGIAAAAVAIDPAVRWGHMAMAYSLQGLFRPEAALASAQTVLRLYPGDPEAIAVISSIEKDIEALRTLR